MPRIASQDDEAGDHGNPVEPPRYPARADFLNHAFTVDELAVPNGMTTANGHAATNGQLHIEHGAETVAETIDGVHDKNNGKDDTAESFRSLLPFCVVFGLGSMFSQSVASYLGSQITVIEKAFGLSSTKSGILLSANDIGFVSTILFASHFLKNHHIPRVLALCVLIFGLSGILTAAPHFISGEHSVMPSAVTNSSDSNSKHNDLCVPGRLNLSESECSQRGSEGGGSRSVEWVVMLIAVSMVIQGVAKAPRQPLSNIYVDSNSPRTNTGFYLGLMTSFTIFGPFLAITLGGVFSKVPVDLKETSLSPEDPRWIGAWWLGFVAFGAVSVLVSVPIYFFPASLRKTTEQQDTRTSEYMNAANVIERKTEKKKRFLQIAAGMPRSIFRVLSQPIYVTFMMGTLANMMSMSSLASFGPKYIENQFRIPTWKANIILGLEKLATTSLGTLSGGIISRRLQLDLNGCVKMVTFVRFLGLITEGFNFIFGCDNPDIIGFNSERSIPMNMSCHCSAASYLPVCADGLTYFSPCHAGCQLVMDNEYSMCAASTSGAVDLGVCETGCKFLIPFVAVNALNSLVQTIGIAPSFVIYLRSVPEKDRAMSVGLHSFLMSLLVFLPAPIIFGKLFDTMCLVWNTSHPSTGSGGHSGKAGACSIYDVGDMRIKFVSIGFGLKAFCVICSLVTVYLVRRKLQQEQNTTTEVIISKPPVPQPRTSIGSKEESTQARKPARHSQA